MRDVNYIVATASYNSIRACAGHNDIITAAAGNAVITALGQKNIVFCTADQCVIAIACANLLNINESIDITI